MKSNDPWKRLAGLARQRETVPPAVEMPLGFDTRVLAQVRPARRLAAEMFGRLAWQAVPVALAALVLCWLTARPPSDAAWADEAKLASQVMEEVLQP